MLLLLSFKLFCFYRLFSYCLLNRETGYCTIFSEADLDFYSRISNLAGLDSCS